MQVETSPKNLTADQICADGTHCLACLGTQFRTWGIKNEFALLKCSECDAVFTAAQAAARVDELYDHYYDGKEFEIAPVVAESLNRLVISFASFRSTGRWLDIGYGQGALLAIAQKSGWTCHGTEMSPQALA